VALRQKLLKVDLGPSPLLSFARSLVAFALAAAGCASSSAESKKLPSLEDSRTITDSVTEALVR
jgi:hypothetical protein